MGFAGADIDLLAGSCISDRCGSSAHWFASGIGLPFLDFVRSKIALPRSCAGVNSPFGKPIAIGTIGQRVDEGHQVGELLLIETLRAVEEFFGARPALGGHVRIAAVPLEGSVPARSSSERLSTISLPKPSGSRSHCRPSMVASRWQLAQPNWPWKANSAV